MWWVRHIRRKNPRVGNFRYTLMVRFVFQFTMMVNVLNCRQLPLPTDTDSDRPQGSVKGIVLDLQGPLSGATVRVQTTNLSTTTDDSGKFTLTDLIPGKPVTLSAWAAGYYIGGGQANMPGDDDVEIFLLRHPAVDNPEYEWLSAFSTSGREGNCQNCHSQSGTGTSRLPFDEWLQDAHAHTVQNIRFITMYLGSDIYGNKSPPTRYGYNPDYGSFPLRPDPAEPYFGPGYKLDFPGTAGNCAACHTPAAAINDPFGINPTELTGVEREGVTCDFCHKVLNVRLDAPTNLPRENMPGVLSFEYRRPPPGHQFFAGPFDDVAPGEDVYSPVQKKSQYCAPCHFAKFWGTTIYNSYGEWLESAYSRQGTVKTCQDCHMPSGLTDHFVLFEKGGRRRNPSTIFSHRMSGASDEDFLRKAVSMTANGEIRGGRLSVGVEITNDGTGHHVPTGSPLRHLILVVIATDSEGHSLEQVGGPSIPDWCGIGDPDDGNYGGLPGSAYGKILEEMWTGISPTGAYWNRTRIVSDNRIPALGINTTHYQFTVPRPGPITVSIRLLFRRTFIRLQAWKGWDIPDILMSRKTLRLEGKQ